MKPNDLILAIDDAPVTDMTLEEEAVDKLRGPVGSNVKLTVRRAQTDPFQITLTRGDIKVDPVKSQLEGNDIAYIRITSFSERTSEGIETAFKALQQKANNKLIGVVLDLRNNPGGLLDEAVGVSNDFLDKGDIVSIKGRLARDNRRFEAQANHDMTKGLPMVVLINGGSASASEIVSGALQDNHRAVILGTQSFGKGSVQTVLPVKESGGAIRLTTALYYTPSGRSIQDLGITPDVTVQPARIEQVQELAIQHEADLRGALKNTGSADGGRRRRRRRQHRERRKPPVTNTTGRHEQGNSDHARAPAAPAATPTPANARTIPAGATPLPKLDEALNPNTFGSDQDYQLVRAIDLLRGVTLFKSMATAAP